MKHVIESMKNKLAESNIRIMPTSADIEKPNNDRCVLIFFDRVRGRSFGPGYWSGKEKRWMERGAFDSRVRVTHWMDVPWPENAKVEINIADGREVKRCDYPATFKAYKNHDGRALK